MHVELDAPDIVVRLAIRDGGIGGADPAGGSGLTGLCDRIEALSGTLDLNSPFGHGTALLIEIPIWATSRPQPVIRPLQLAGIQPAGLAATANCRWRR